MKFKTIIDSNREEEIIAYVHQKTKLIKEIETLIENYSTEFYGYNDNIVTKLSLNDIYCFIVEDNKLFASTEKNKYLLKRRLYQVEDILTPKFIKINRSCIINIDKIARFDVTFAGSLKIILKNEYSDFVSRRQIKVLKERIGL